MGEGSLFSKFIFSYTTLSLELLLPFKNPCVLQSTEIYIEGTFRTESTFL